MIRKGGSNKSAIDFSLVTQTEQHEQSDECYLRSSMAFEKLYGSMPSQISVNDVGVSAKRIAFIVSPLSLLAYRLETEFDLCVSVCGFVCIVRSFVFQSQLLQRCCKSVVCPVYKALFVFSAHTRARTNDY